MDELQVGFELRPLSTGEILDRTFALYRRRFWLYAGLSSVAAAVATLGTFVQLSLGLTGQMQNGSNPAAAGKAALLSGAVSLGVVLVHLLAYAITQAATVAAVEANYLGRETSIGAAFSDTGAKWYRYILITLWQAWSFSWPIFVLLIPVAVAAGFASVARVISPIMVGLLVIVLLLPAFVAGFILYLRNALGIVACVSERLTVRQSMKRSKFLVADRKVGIFLLYLLVLVLALVAGSATGVLSLFLRTSHGGARAAMETLTLAITFLMNAIVQPIGAIAFVLFYLDQRVRKEGFDVEHLLEGTMRVKPLAHRFADESVWSSPELESGEPRG